MSISFIWALIAMSTIIIAQPVDGSKLVKVETYRFSEQRFKSDDVSLFSKLLIPPTEGPHPAIIIVHGAGPNTFGGQYMQLAQIFAENGIATLFYDKRGTGQSEGEYHETPPTMDYYARDVLTAAAWLKTHKNIDPERIGVWGHSQGGWIGPYAATLGNDINFVINVSGPGVTPMHQIAYQRAQQLMQSKGISQKQAKHAEELRHAAYRYWHSGKNYNEESKIYKRLSKESFFKHMDGWSETLQPAESLSENSRMFFAKRTMSFDPKKVYRSIKIPTLIIYGIDDWQIPVKASVKAIKEVLPANPNKDITIKVFEGAGHGIMVRGKDKLMYFQKGYTEYMLDWLKQRIFAKEVKSR